MVPKELNDWLQVLGLFGVLGGLIFVGLQLRLDRQVALAEGTTSALDSRTAWAELVNDNAALWARGLSGETLSVEEAHAFDALASTFVFRYYTSFDRARQLTGSPPERFAFELAAEIHKYPGLLRWWQETRDRLDEARDRLGRGASPWGEAVSTELARLSKENDPR